MNKTELVTAVAEKTGLSKKDISEVIGATTEVVTERAARDGRKRNRKRSRI